MRKYLPEGYKIEDEKGSIYTIIEKIGEGASCIVYRSEFDKTGSNCILKEYYPCHITLERGKTGEVFCKENEREKFEEGLRNYQQGCRHQIALRNKKEVMNQIFDIRDYFSANNTWYVATSTFYGKSFKEKEASCIL